MVKIVGEIGPLKELQLRLHINKLEDFSKKYYELKEKEDLLSKKGKEECEKDIKNMREKLKNHAEKLDSYLKNNNSHIFKILGFFKTYNKRRRIGVIKTKINNIENNIEYYSGLKVQRELREIEYQHKLLISLKPTYYGAVGEKIVVDEFKNIYSSGILINDFNQHFHEPIFKKGGKDPIMSVQIDHIFVSERGIFLIETKNWKSSSDSMGAYSPIKQAERHNTGFYRLLKRMFDNDYALQNQSMPTIYNLVVFTGEYKEESTSYFVKSIRPKQIKGFVESKKPVLSTEGFRYLSEKLISINESY